MIGPIVITVTAILTVSDGSLMLAAAPDGIRPELIALRLDKIFYKKYCSGNLSLSFINISAFHQSFQ